MASRKKDRPKNAQPDVPDSRDWIYDPPLIELPPVLAPPEDLHLLDQGFCIVIGSPRDDSLDWSKEVASRCLGHGLHISVGQGVFD